ncbi:MAG: Nif3-like dinuclear metal center hexameric protein [Rhodoferax sp.]
MSQENAVALEAVLAECEALLQCARFKDYGPNGLQVQGRGPVRRIVSGVTASRALIEAALAAQADTLLVHHGLFWRGHDGRVTGWLRERLALLLAHDLHLLAYHLPLDAHPELGNNAQWAQRMGWQAHARFGEQELGFLGQRAQGQPYVDAQALAQHLQSVLNRGVTVVQPQPKAIQTIAWCSGGAQGYFEAAIAAGADAFVTGEISEPQVHLARECGVAFLACGHHASERYGVQALGQHLAARFGVAHHFIDIDSPA